MLNFTQKELKRMMLLSYQRIEREKEEINKINVFPVPDQDTGNNMEKTLLGIKGAIEKKEFKDLDEISEAILDGALTAAQGNAGVIYTGFLAGFLPQLDKSQADSKRLAIAFEEGAKRARESIENPTEGTILDVVDATAQAFKQEAERETNIIAILKKAIEQANEALINTREKMEVFKKANVVDAGGLAFLVILESFLESLEGERKKKRGKEKPSERIKRFVQVLSNRYEIVSLIENPRFDKKIIQEKLKILGDSIDIVKIKNKIKIHIHTDYPDEVKDVLRKTGQIQSLRVEDMTKEVIGEESIRKVSIGIVTEDVAMLLPKIAEKYQIEIIPAEYEWPPEKNLPGENIYQKLREADKRGIKILPKSSQPSPSDYLNSFQKQLEKFDSVLGITLSAEASDCYNSAKQAKSMAKNSEKIFVLDSKNAAAGQALLVLRAIELIQEQREITEVIDKLKKEIPHTHLYMLFENPKWIEAIGRITKSQAGWIRKMKKINLHPIMELKEGKMTKGGIVFAQSMAEALFKKIEKDSKKDRKENRKIRAIINHADNLEEAQKLKKMLKEEIKADIPFINLGPPIFGAAGPGTIIVGWMPIE